jgi:acetoin utilization deacetylase AcuC-like enzyme
VLDVDAHHGNGTQDVFWERRDVLVASVHVDPGAGWFPHFLGFSDETGSGPGEGAT